MKLDEAVQKILLAKKDPIYDVTAFVKGLLENFGEELDDEFFQTLLDSPYRKCLIAYPFAKDRYLQRILEDDRGDELIFLAQREILPPNILTALFELVDRYSGLGYHLASRKDLSDEQVSLLIGRGVARKELSQNYTLSRENLDVLIEKREGGPKDDMGEELVLQPLLTVSQMKILVVKYEAMGRLIQLKNLPETMVNWLFASRTEGYIFMNEASLQALIEHHGSKLKEDLVLNYLLRFDDIREGSSMELLANFHFSDSGFRQVCKWRNDIRLGLVQIKLALLENPYLDMDTKKQLAIEVQDKSRYYLFYHPQNWPTEIMDIFLENPLVEVRRWLLQRQHGKDNAPFSLSALSKAYLKERSKLLKATIAVRIKEHLDFQKQVAPLKFVKLNSLENMDEHLINLVAKKMIKEVAAKSSLNML